ncbi:N-acetylmuramoyl-L-alanine amidase [Microbulbifer sp. 2201CG32-9]|uniref:N-acetylmuramoyl-L-alanine amidase n=1 Tax=Microbulbifer sp. 2201CG32-9 TaxID=3232309 RepID=UPI00345BC110
MNWKPIKSVDYLVVHCSATRPSQEVTAEDIELWHRRRGWAGIGYHYVIERDGVLKQGRPDDRPGAHARGFNHLSLGFCLVGGLAEDGKTPQNNFTLEQFDTLRNILEYYKTHHPEAEVLGHRDLGANKACPCFDVREWWAR